MSTPGSPDSGSPGFGESFSVEADVNNDGMIEFEVLDECFDMATSGRGHRLRRAYQSLTRLIRITEGSRWTNTLCGSLSAHVKAQGCGLRGDLPVDKSGKVDVNESLLLSRNGLPSKFAMEMTTIGASLNELIDALLGISKDTKKTDSEREVIGIQDAIRAQALLFDA